MFSFCWKTYKFIDKCLFLVIAIDIDAHKIELARNNAEIYGVANRIEFIVGDFMELSNKLKADRVFLSPPWGGPSYVNNVIYDLEEYLQPVPLSKLLTAAKNISDSIALFLPRNSDTYAVSYVLKIFISLRYVKDR